MDGKIYPLRIKPGIKQDGTTLATPNYLTGQWTRFQRGIPKKMGGYVEIAPPNNAGRLSKIQRGSIIIPNGPNYAIYTGDSDNLNKISINQTGDAITNFGDRTPVGFQTNANYLWTFDSMYSTTDNSSSIIAHAAPNLSSIDSDVETNIYYGVTNSNTKLIPIGVSVSGGIVVLHPYLFAFGNAGDVRWSDKNNPTLFDPDDFARIASRKIVAGFASRGGNSSPAGLLWSLDSLIRVTFVGEPAVFKFDTVTSDSSILSSGCVVEYDGTYFWPAIDRFLVYNGVVKEVPNDMSLNFFYDNLNYSQRQKIWGTKVPRFGEIWWFFPKGNSPECNHAVILNVREGTWYDTPINRSCGYFSQTFQHPVWIDNSQNEDHNYPMWKHELGVDKVSNRPGLPNTYSAIEAFFETGDISWCAAGPDGQYNFTDRWVDLYRIEPDFIQSGDMEFTVIGNEYANSPIVTSAPYVFNSNTEKIDTREQRRQMRLRFRSNVIGGNYEMGQVLVVMRIGDGRQ